MLALRDRLDGSLDRPFYGGIARRRRCPRVASKLAAFAPAEGVTYARKCNVRKPAGDFTPKSGAVARR